MEASSLSAPNGPVALKCCFSRDVERVRQVRGDLGQKHATHHVAPEPSVRYVAPATTVLVATSPVIEHTTPATRGLLHQRQFIEYVTCALTLQWRSWYWPLEVPPPGGGMQVRPTVHPARWPLQASSSASSWALCRGEKRCPQLPRTQVHPAGLGKMFSGCDIFTCALVSSVTVPALHLRTVPQGSLVSSKTVFSHYSSHRVAPIRTTRTQRTLVSEQVTAHFANPRLAARAHRTAAEDACLFQAATGGRKSSCVQVINFFSFVCGAMASSAVFSELYLRDAAGNHAVTHTGAYIYNGDAASFR